jgi:hypothetical protein
MKRSCLKPVSSVQKARDSRNACEHSMIDWKSANRVATYIRKVYQNLKSNLDWQRDGSSLFRHDVMDIRVSGTAVHFELTYPSFAR